MHALNRFAGYAIILTVALTLGCGKNEPRVAREIPKESETKPSTAQATPESTDTGDGQQSGGRLGVISSVRGAGQRTIALNDLRTLAQYIQQIYVLENRMPDVDRIKAELRDAPNVLQHIQNGDIILTGTKDGGGIWAYHKEASGTGYLVIQNGSPIRMTKQDFEDVMGK